MERGKDSYLNPAVTHTTRTHRDKTLASFKRPPGCLALALHISHIRSNTINYSDLTVSLTSNTCNACLPGLQCFHKSLLDCHGLLSVMQFTSLLIFHICSAKYRLCSVDKKNSTVCYHVVKRSRCKRSL